MRTWFERMKYLVKQAGLTQDDVAELLGVTSPAVNHYFNGRRTPSIRQIKTIAEALGMSVSELIGDTAYFVTDEKEKDLIDTIRSLPQHQQEVALTLLKALNNTPSKDE